ncbi:hypothetical protein RJ639_029370 [Escallonia herrerae]|uniref:Acyltransferase n=1 Tax=Escallonia herrerae TaxID=1293975 RepID=A0AA88X6B0_9ASTE|nr:hypothetical protein RJ639_029370 [Escallonia herrerae]
MFCLPHTLTNDTPSDDQILPSAAQRHSLPSPQKLCRIRCNGRDPANGLDGGLSSAASTELGALDSEAGSNFLCKCYSDALKNAPTMLQEMFVRRSAEPQLLSLEKARMGDERVNLGISPAPRTKLANNRLSGEIPYSFGYMVPGLKEILFLNNQFTGCIPQVVGLWQDLQVFVLSFNSWMGHFPDSISCFNEIQVSVQLNIFASGSGIAVGVHFLHKMLDAVSMAAFLQCWAVIARDGDKEATLHQLHLTARSGLFPPVEAVPSTEQYLLKPHWVAKEGTGVRTRFVFDATAISALKAKARSQLVPNPSAVLAVLSFIRKCAVAASGKPTKPSVLACAVNIGPEWCRLCLYTVLEIFVCEAMVTSVLSDEDEREKQLPNLVCLLRAAIAKVDSGLTQFLQGVTRFTKVSSFWEEMEEINSRGSVDRPLADETIVLNS